MQQASIHSPLDNLMHLAHVVMALFAWVDIFLPHEHVRFLKRDEYIA